MPHNKLEQISRKMEREKIKYRQIQSFFTSIDTIKERNLRKDEMDEIVKQLQNSAAILARFRKEYDDLMVEVAKLIMENQND